MDSQQLIACLLALRGAPWPTQSPSMGGATAHAQHASATHCRIGGVTPVGTGAAAPPLHGSN